LFAVLLAFGPAMAASPEQGNLVIVNITTLGCPALADMQRVTGIAVHQNYDAALSYANRRGCRQMAEGLTGVVERSGRPDITDCVRPVGEHDCFWTARLRLSVVERVDYDPFAMGRPVQRKATHPPAERPVLPGTNSVSDFAIGRTVAIKLPSLACPSLSDWTRIFELIKAHALDRARSGKSTPNEALIKFGNTSGCRQLAMNTVATVDQIGTEMICVRATGENRCFWTYPAGIVAR
jgi:hypothetical protein